MSEDRVAVKALLKTLSYRERDVVKLRWGIDDGYIYTLEEVGKIFKVTVERVRSIEKKALDKLDAAGVSQQSTVSARLAEVAEEIQELEIVRHRLQKQA